MDHILIGIDIGGTNVKIGSFTEKLELIAKTSTATDADMGPESVVERITESIKAMCSEKSIPAEDISFIGIGSPGPADYKRGIIINSTNMPKFRDVPLRDMIADRFGAEAVLENDANTACWGEYSAGSGKDVDDMVFLTLGTGIGGGIVADGKMIRGCDGNGAELGHIIIHPEGRLCNCGQKGCAEAYASASSTARRAAEAVESGKESSLSLLKEITCRDVFEHMKKGDALAEETVNGTAADLALLCINILHTTEPRRIVLAGGMIAAGDILLEKIRASFDRYIWKLKQEKLEICFASLGEDAGIYGAASLISDYQNRR